LDVFGALLTGTNDFTPILLKILDPLPDEIYGDLYFELHNEKREVYVVTHVDNRAWPDSVGKIRYGFSQAKISEFADAQSFKQAYLEAVEAYRQVRMQIDATLDRLRSNHQVGRNDIVPVATRKQWQKEIDPHLLKREEILRKAMNSFSALRDLRLGDVVQVHPHTPHSLQHGVRVIEFQTPHYERYILSFAQKVVTQDYWDTEKALDQVQLEEASHAETEISDTSAATLESIIADFDEFTATRIFLKPGMNWTMNAESYCLVIGVQGTATIGNRPLQPEDGYYIAASSKPVLICNNNSVAATFLIARPKISQ
jgi:mannose-6-phosphate isomerase class I